MCKRAKRSFLTLINNKSIWEYHIDSKNTIQAQSIIEQENARIFCGLSVEQYENLVGTNYWASEETTLGIYESKSDVLTYYRSQKLIESILNDLSIKEVKKK